MNKKLLNGKLWFAWSLCLTGFGLLTGLTAFVAAGAGMGGSGCSQACINQATTIALLGLTVLTGAVVAAALSIITSWMCQKPTRGIWIRSFITVIDICALFVSSTGAVFLWGLL